MDTHHMRHGLSVPNDIDMLVCAGDAVDNEFDPDNCTDFLNWFDPLPGVLLSNSVHYICHDKKQQI